jgi:photosystem II stability/assembly factor-like uncharacterized protein
VFPEVWYWYKGKDAVREEVAISLQAQADGMADQARRYLDSILAPISDGGGAAWWPVRVPIYEDFERIEFFDTQTGWILGRWSLLSSVDGGKTWRTQRFDGTNRLHDFHAIDAQTVWTIGDDGAAFHLDERGQWHRHEFGITSRLYGVSFSQDGSAGWIVGEEGLLIATSDAGETWTRQASGTSQNLVAVHAFDQSTVWIGGARVSLFTEDGGATWVNLGPEYTITNAQFISDTEGFANQGNLLYRSADSGRTWNSRELTGRNIAIRGFDYHDSMNVWLANARGQVFHTNDGGNTWVTLQTPATQLNDVHFLDGSNGFAVGDDGVLLNTSPIRVDIDDETPRELISILKESEASAYFEREGIVERLEQFADDYEALIAALARLQEAD